MLSLKRAIKYLFSSILLFSYIPALAATYSGGSGSQSEPYQIATADDIITLGQTTEDYDKYFIMTADIDLADSGTFTQAVIAGDTDTDYYFDGTEFTGSFDGDGHTISNLTVSGDDYCGLFGYIGEGGIVSNLGLENVSITGGGYVGGLCGYNYYGSITSCYASGSVTGSYNFVGGLCGYNDNGSIISCYASGSVTGTFGSVGGLCGYNRGSITSCYASGSVTGTYNYVGGLCGYNYYGSITSCYASGSVTGGGYVGGLCGYNYYCSITSCYASGSVTGGGYDVGGLCGYNYHCSITSSYWNIETSGLSVSDGGWGLNDSQMRQSESYFGWTDGSWTIDEGNSYPRLAWENAGGVVINTDFPVATYAGAGIETSPYEIDSADDLVCLGYRVEDWDKYFVMTANIDLSGHVFNGSVLGYAEYFTGNFNGKGHVISNLTVSGISCCGLFGYIGEGGIVSNLGLENVSITGDEYVGGLCGYNNYGSITSCYASGSVTGDDCIGGLCGYNRGSITSCYATGSVTGEDDYVGGLCGYNYSGSITSCYASGSVTGDDCIGGLCGRNYYGSITSCYASSSVTGDGSYVGGFCGYQRGSSAEMENCFWDTETSGQTDGYYLDSSYPGTVTNVLGKSTAEMQTITTFTDAGWDFSSNQAVWKEVVGWYPFLAWQDDVVIVTVPDFSGLTSEEAQVLAENHSLSIYIAGYDYSNYYDEGTVYSQSLKIGNTALAGTEIEVYISLGPIFSGGSGTTEDPYQIDSVDDLLLLGENTDFYADYFILTSDLDLSGYEFSQAVIAGDTDTDSPFDGTEFTGSFDGDAHTISNLTVSGACYCGLFGKTGSGCSISNLGLVNVSITGTGYYVGGLCGGNGYGSITSCYASGSVTGDFYVGGLCGGNGYGSITSCYATGSVTGEDDYVGGLCGENYRGSITSCYASGSVTGEDDYVGGLCGYNYYGSITSCYASGSVTGDGSRVGGFCGYQRGSSSEMENCFWDTETSGQTDGYYLDSSYPGTVTNVLGKTTAEMQNQTNFTDAGWDFNAESANGTDDIWHMPYNSTGYPMLYFQRDIPGDLTASYGINIADFAQLSDNWQTTYTIEDLETIAQNWLLGL